MPEESRWTEQLIEVVDNHRHRALQMTLRDGRFVVKDGMIVPSGKPSPFFEKCGGPNV